MLYREEIYEEIDIERDAQDVLWGGPEDDDRHTNYDWIAFLSKHLGRSVIYNMSNKKKKKKFRKQMVIIAALAVAAIEWYDRKYGEE